MQPSNLWDCNPHLLWSTVELPLKKRIEDQQELGLERDKFVSRPIRRNAGLDQRRMTPVMPGDLQQRMRRKSLREEGIASTKRSEGVRDTIAEAEVPAKPAAAVRNKLVGSGGGRRVTPTVGAAEVVKVLRNGGLDHGGLASGEGKFSKPTGVTFKDELEDRRMEGFDTFICADGKIHRETWITDRKHGLVTKTCGDVVPRGCGLLAWPDVKCYVGSWSRDPKSQQQINNAIYPTSGVFADRRKSCSSFDGASARGSTVERNFPRICIWESDGDTGDITCDIIDTLEASILYKDGTNSDQVDADSDDLQCRIPHCFTADEVKKPGKTISKGHKNYDLMLNLQLGIRYSVGRLAPREMRELRPFDFDPREKFWTRFPPEGSKTTPPHQSAEFRWKDYCPVVFRHLRKLFAVDPADYMMALCGNDALRELSSPGKSGSFFYLTQDDRFIIKTVKKSEVKVLIRMLPNYYQHVCQYENSLVTKFFGVHSVKPNGGPKVRFVVMGNLFCSDYQIHRRFDLKGSSHGRTTNKAEEEIDETTTLKDLDLNFVFRLQSSWFKKLTWQIERDCEFLEEEGIMDYSLLVGLHFRDDKSSQKISGESESIYEHGSLAGFYFSELGCRDAATFVDGRKQTLIHLGTEMPARAEHVSRLSDSENSPLANNGSLQMPPARCGEIYEVILNFGVIDILQDYDISKKLEHAYKSLQVDPTSISAVDPKLYSKRFRDFISRVFVEDEND